MVYRVGYIDEDIHYAINLMEYINSQKDFKLSMSAFSDRESLLIYLQSHKMDIVIIGDGVAPFEFNIPFIRICGISEEASRKGFIYKYQNADKIAGGIINSLQLTMAQADKEHRIYGVYSPIGRCGKTSFAMALCKQLDYIYVCMEEYFWHEYSKDDNSNAKAFLYYWATGNEEIKQFLQKNMNMDTPIGRIVGLEKPKDMRQLNSENVRWLAGFLETNKSVGIVLDIGVSAIEDFSFITGLDYLFIPVLSDESSKAKLECFKKRHAGLLEEMSERLSYVSVPACAYDSEEMKEYVEEVL